MKITKITLATLVAMSAAFTSCDSDDDISEEGYNFSRNGETTVSFSGQTARLQMVNEIGAAFKETTTTVADFTEMFVDGTGFSDADLDASGKNVNGKTGAKSADQSAVQTTIQSYYKNQVAEVFPNWAKDASSGVAGRIPKGDDAYRYVNAKGLEYDQAFYKGLIGALVGDQTMNNYLGTLSDDENDVVSEGKSYTEMEHHFDEAYGYIYGNIDADALMYKYIGKVDEDSDFAGIAETIENAFIAGRTAIVNKDYDARDAQISIIRENLSKVIAVRAVHYLQDGAASVGTSDSFHALSEAYGFIYSLQFTHNPTTGEPYFTATEVQAFLDKLEGNTSTVIYDDVAKSTADDLAVAIDKVDAVQNVGFWALTKTILDDMSDDISKEFDFTTAQAAN